MFESYMKMPKHTTLLLLQVKSSVSDSINFDCYKDKTCDTEMYFLFLICISEVDAGEILQMFGKMFFEFCQESGYDTILRVLGSNVREFLQVSSYSST